MELNSVGVIYYEYQQQKNLASSFDLIAGIDTRCPHLPLPCSGKRKTLLYELLYILSNASTLRKH